MNFDFCVFKVFQCKYDFGFFYYKALSFPKIMNLNLYHSDSAMCRTMALK